MSTDQTHNTDGQVVHPLPEGTLVRISRELTEDEKSWADWRTYNPICRVAEYLEGGDPEQDEIPVPFYYLDADGGGNNVVVPADAVEVVMTIEQAAARKMPTAETILSELNLLGDYDTFETDSSDRDGPNAREVYGKTYEGLTFGFRVQVTAIWETDL